MLQILLIFCQLTAILSKIYTNLCEFENAEQCGPQTIENLSNSKQFFLNDILSLETPFNQYKKFSTNQKVGQPYVIFTKVGYKNFQESCAVPNHKLKLNDVVLQNVQFCYCHNSDSFEMQQTDIKLPVYNIYREFLPSFKSVEDIKNFQVDKQSSAYNFMEKNGKGDSVFLEYPTNVNCYLNNDLNHGITGLDEVDSTASLYHRHHDPNFCRKESMQFRMLREKSVLMSDSTYLFYNQDQSFRNDKKFWALRQQTEIYKNFTRVLRNLQTFQSQTNQDDSINMQFSWNYEIEKKCLFSAPISARDSKQLLLDYRISCLVREANLKMEVLKEIFELRKVFGADLNIL